MTKCVKAGEGRQFNVIGGDLVCIKVAGEETEVLRSAGNHGACRQRPPAACPYAEDETFYIVDGQFEFRVAGQTVHAGAGCTLVAARGTPHAFRNVGDAPGKMLIIVRPAGFEKFIEEFSTLPVDGPLTLAAWPRSPASMGSSLLRET